MVTIKISELDLINDTTPNTDVLAIVSNGATKKITVNNLINSADNITISGKMVASSFTGSLLGNVTGTSTNNLLTASNATEDDTIEFEKGNGNTFSVKINNVETASYVEYTNIANKPTLVSESIQIILQDTNGNLSGSRIEGTVELANTASYVEYTNIANKPTLVSGSEQITLIDTIGNLSGSRINSAVELANTASYILASNIDQPFSIIEITGSLGISGSAAFNETQIILNTSSLPTTDPNNIGQLWRSGSVGNEVYLMVSLG